MQTWYVSFPPVYFLYILCDVWLIQHIRTTSTIAGRLALKLVDKKISYHHKSAVISLVYVTILWAVEPLQAIYISVVTRKQLCVCVPRVVRQVKNFCNVSTQLVCSRMHRIDLHMGIVLDWVPKLEYQK